MSFNKFVKIITSGGKYDAPVTSSDFNRLQDNIQESLQPIVEKVQLDSNVIQGIELAQGIVNNVPHKLNRIPIKFHHIAYSQCDVWFSQKADRNFVYLMCSADTVIDIEVS